MADSSRNECKQLHHVCSLFIIYAQQSKTIDGNSETSQTNESQSPIRDFAFN